MPYKVRRGKLHFEPATGNGPCRRSRMGEPGRRELIPTYHATKGHRPPRQEAGIAWFLTMPPGPPAVGRNRVSAERNRPRASVPGGERRAQKRIAG